jgi:hypothetical protein
MATAASVLWRKWGWMIGIIAGFIVPPLLTFPSSFILPDAEVATFGLVAVGWVLAQLVTLLAWLLGQWSGRAAAFVLLAAFGAVMGFGPALVVHAAAKQLIVRSLVARSAPVVAAIDAFHAAKGEWPDRIDDLVPGFLPAHPETGWAIYPDYEIYQGSAEDPWALVIPMYESLKFDALYYCPVADCEGQIRAIGGNTTRVGKWIFLDE